MNTYNYRDTRREKLAEVIAALSEEHADLLSILKAEQAALQTDDWTVTDTTYKAVATDFIWNNFTTIGAFVDQDPVLVALDSAPLLSPAHATAISTISMPHSGLPPADYLEKVLIAVDNDDAIFTGLVLATHQAWLKAGIENADYPFDDVGVLLPVRLETIFDPPASKNNEDINSWKLSIRVIPDEASICRHNSFISKDEGKALIAFWKSIKQAGNVNKSWLETAESNIAWKQLSSRIRPERAAWLVSNIGIKMKGDKVEIIFPADMPAETEPNRVGGIPPEIKIFAVTTMAINGSDHNLIGRLPMDPDAKINMADLSLPLTSDLAKQKDSWWASWKEAKAVGLGGEYTLPVGMTPGNIQALYVIGIGEETPDALFTAQVNSGELSISRLGDATNTIHGSNTGQPIDWQKTAASRLDERLNPIPGSINTGNRIQQHLTGRMGSLPFFPGSDGPDDTLQSQQLAKALWPALWGHWMHEIWNMGDEAYRRGLWAIENLCPEGPLMPIRISDQPYGLLPVTSLELWAFSLASDPETAAQQRVEMEMVKLFSQLSNRWANAAGEKRSVVGKTSAEFMNLLAQNAISNRYVQRNFFPFLVEVAMYSLDAARAAEFRDRALQSYKSAISLMGREPGDIYLANSYGEYLTLPLVQSTNTLFRHQQGENRAPLDLKSLLLVLIHFFERDDLQNYDLELVFKKFHVLENQAEFQFGSLPDSLLVRLLVYACQVSTLGRQKDPGNVLLQRMDDIFQKEAIALAEEIDQKKWIQKDTDPVTGRLLFKSIIPDEILKKWERAFCATLDTAANRIDPWVTGFAWQRLKEHSSSSRHNHRLGVYGWVDGPFKGQPGPTESGLLHTPSYNQTLAALIMRDKFLSSTRTSIANENGQNPWQMNITSQKVRMAEEIADEVRMGFHIYEVLGRHVENIVGKPIKVRELRANPKYSMRDERNDPKEVCDGNKALSGLLKGDPDFPMNADQQKALQLLQDSLDTYSDLLMGDGILQLINRQTDRAAETMDAAGGFSRPPSFEFIQTPPSGYHLETIVLSALPFVSIQSLAGDTHPIRLADPSVANFIEKKLGTQWKWTAINEDDNTIIDSLTLPDLNLSPLDTLAISDDLIRELVRYKLGLPLVYISKAGNRQWEAFDEAGNFLGRISISALNVDPGNLPEQPEFNKLIQTKLGVPQNSIIKETTPDDLQLWVAKNENQALLGLVDKTNLGPVPEDEEERNKKIRQFLHIPKLRIDAAREHQLAQQLVAALGSRPAGGRDFTDNKSVPEIPDINIYGELVTRYTAVYNACKKLITKLKAAKKDADIITALREALPWGIVPATDPADREALMSALAGLELPELATPLKKLAKNVADALTTRKNAAVNPKDLVKKKDIGSPLENHKDLKEANKPDGVPSLARAIANLASPNAKIAILACWGKASIINNTRLVTNQPEDIEEEWLTVVAAVRANLARLEALQLEMAGPLISWSNSPNDPWRTGDENIVQQNLNTRNTTSVVKLEMNRFVAAYGTAETWESDKVAVGLIDSFNEAIPMPQRKTSVAFGFNAPSARAPQAILLAVPPQPRQRLDVDLLLKIVEETRTLAHARTARVEDLGDLQALAPTMWLQGTGVTRVRLEPGPLFVD